MLGFLARNDRLLTGHFPVSLRKRRPRDCRWEASTVFFVPLSIGGIFNGIGSVKVVENFGFAFLSALAINRRL